MAGEIVALAPDGMASTSHGRKVAQARMNAGENRNGPRQGGSGR